MTADLDGVWTTKNTLFVNGTYKAVLMEYAPDDKQFATALNKASDGIVFAVDGSGGGGSISAAAPAASPTMAAGTAPGCASTRPRRP